MANPSLATTSRDGSRFYSWRGENFYSVTTMINGGLPKPALINWAKKFTAEYACDHLAALTALVEDDRDGAVDWLKNAAWRDRDKKAELGTYIHEATEAYVLGKPFPKWKEEARPRMQQFERFLADFEPEYVMTEATVFNKTHRYAGTLDAIVELGRDVSDDGAHWSPGRLFIIDQKTSKAIYPEVALQLAMYRHAEFIGLPDGSERPMPKVDGACALQLLDHDYELVDVDTSEEVFRYTLHVREVYRWKLEMEKHVLRGPLRIADDGVERVGQMLLEAQE
jgi:hypothetical protein